MTRLPPIYTVLGWLHAFKSPFKVSSDRKDRESARELNDPGKNREIAENFSKRREIREFPFNYIIFEK